MISSKQQSVTEKGGGSNSKKEANEEETAWRTSPRKLGERRKSEKAAQIAAKHNISLAPHEAVKITKAQERQIHSYVDVGMVRMGIKTIGNPVHAAIQRDRHRKPPMKRGRNTELHMMMSGESVFSMDSRTAAGDTEQYDSQNCLCNLEEKANKICLKHLEHYKLEQEQKRQEAEEKKKRD